MPSKYPEGRSVRPPQRSRASLLLEWEADVRVTELAAEYESSSTYISRVLAGADPFPQRLRDILTLRVGPALTRQVEELAAEAREERAARQRLSEAVPS